MTRRKLKAAVPPELDPTRFVSMAPELVGHEHELTVIRNDDDTDEDHERSCELLTLVIEAAKKR